MSALGHKRTLEDLRLCNDHSVDLRAAYPNWPLRESTAVAVDYLHFKKAAAKA